MIFGLFRSRADRERTQDIYAAIVAQARQPAFYAQLGVPDTLEGRYDMLMLHAFLYMHRLKNEAEPTRRVAQQVFDAMFMDMDRSLREMGVGDLSVPKKIKKMAQAFYGRAAVYDVAVGKGRDALTESLRRNLFGGDTEAVHAGTISNYVLRAVDLLAGQTTDDLTTRGPVFPDAAELMREEGQAR